MPVETRYYRDYADAPYVNVQAQAALYFFWLYWAPAPRYLTSLSDGRSAGGGQSVLPMLPSLPVMLAGSMPYFDSIPASGRCRCRIHASFSVCSGQVTQRVRMVMPPWGRPPAKAAERTQK